MEFGVRAATAALLLLSVSSNQASAKTFYWEKAGSSFNSAFFAFDESELIATSSLSWFGGSSAIVTYWRSGKTTFRCIDYFDKNMRDTGGACWFAKWRY